MNKTLTLMLVVLCLLPSATRGMFFPAYTNIKKVCDHSVTLVKTTKDKLVTVYTPKTDTLFIGKAELTSLHYMCYENLFYEVFITTKGKANFEYLKEALLNCYKEELFNYYGERIQAFNSSNHCYWILPDSGNLSLYLTLRYNPANQVATLRITYNPLLDYILGDFSEKAAFNGEKDFIAKVTTAYRS